MTDLHTYMHQYQYTHIYKYVIVAAHCCITRVSCIKHSPDSRCSVRTKAAAALIWSGHVIEREGREEGAVIDADVTEQMAQWGRAVPLSWVLLVTVGNYSLTLSLTLFHIHSELVAPWDLSECRWAAQHIFSIKLCGSEAILSSTFDLAPRK